MKLIEIKNLKISKFKAAVDNYECPLCKQKPGENCVYVTGFNKGEECSTVHNERLRLVKDEDLNEDISVDEIDPRIKDFLIDVYGAYVFRSEPIIETGINGSIIVTLGGPSAGLGNTEAVLQDRGYQVSRKPSPYNEDEDILEVKVGPYKSVTFKNVGSRGNARAVITFVPLKQKTLEAAVPVKNIDDIEWKSFKVRTWVKKQFPRGFKVMDNDFFFGLFEDPDYSPDGTVNANAKYKIVDSFSDEPYESANLYDNGVVLLVADNGYDVFYIPKDMDEDALEKERKEWLEKYE